MKSIFIIIFFLLKISVGKVYRLIKSLQLPKMSTVKPVYHKKHNDNGKCTDYLNQNFNQKATNPVWVSDFTYIKAGNKWYYMCIIMDLFSRKIIAWNISGKPDAALIITTFRNAYKKRNHLTGSYFTQTVEPCILPSPSDSYWILCM